MNILSLATFKEDRKQYGTIAACYKMLSTAGIPEEQADHFLDGVACDIGTRNVEKAKSKKVYGLVDGYLLAVQEYQLKHN